MTRWKKNKFETRCIKWQGLQFLGFIDFKSQLREAMKFNLFQHLPAGIDSH
jgi:hypothetical protein